MNNPIHIDPFFDGEGGIQKPVQLPGYEGMPQQQAVAPLTGTTYQDMNGQYLEDGRPMTAGMRGSTAGLRGTIIPKATMGGIPIGTQPHHTANVQVNIDPHLPEGQKITLTLGEITAASIQNAEAMADQAGIPQATDIATLRLRSSAVLQGIEAQTPQMPRFDQQPPAVSGPAVPNIAAPNMEKIAMTAPQPTRQARPLAAFHQQPAPVPQQAGPVVQQVDLSQQAPMAERAAPPPTKTVVFEIEHFGVIKQKYHEVINSDGILILVYNTRYPGGEMYIPPFGDKTPEMALQVDGDPLIYLVRTTGIHYAYGDNEFCILVIERTTTVPPNEQPQETHTGYEPQLPPEGFMQ